VNKLISAWTEDHVPAALALVVAVLTGGLATTQPAPIGLLAVGVALATAAGALFLDAFGGLVLGVTASAVFVLGMQFAGLWSARSFATSLAQVLALLALGFLVGILSARLHGRGSARPEAEGGVAPAYGSLGLLTEDVALARLDDEIVRARRHRRPLTVVVIRVTIAEADLAARARTAAVRAVARLVETLLRETDVPFALEDGELGAILPETDAASAWDVLGPVLDAATRAAFTVRDDDERRSLVDCAELHAGLAELGQQHPDADSLVRAARAQAREDEDEDESEGRGAPTPTPGTAA
jgi:GGDEF domain-containing protein